jgi:type VI secretion system protein ImpC
MTSQTQNHASTQPASTGELSLLDQILSDTKMKPTDDGYAVAKKGLTELVKSLVGERRGEKIDKALVDVLIADLDAKISGQVNSILHHEKFQKLESSWRGLHYLVGQTDFRENIRIDVLSCTKDELLADFEDSPEIPKSGLYQLAYSREYGTFGGQPYGALVSGFDFDAGPQDMKLLANCAAVAATAHAPFIANANPEMFGLKDFTELPKMRDLASVFEGPQYARWRSFRAHPDSKYVGLAMPRMMLRLPYGQRHTPVKAFQFEEDVIGDHDAYLWGAASFAMASRVHESFAKYRWATNIVGPQAGGAVEGLPLHQYDAMGEVATKIPTEIALTDRREYELAEEGFIGLTYRKESDNAAFFSANSCHKPLNFPDTPEGREARTNYMLGTRLPYLFSVTRIAHYLKVLQREQIGTSKERVDLERELQNWLKQFVVDMDTTDAITRARRPFRKAQVTVEDVDGQPGWYRCGLKVRPHFKFEGASFTLSLVGRLDKS